MRMIPSGDYYVWYCEWCDSRNSIVWTRAGAGSVTCSACQHAFGIGDEGNLFDVEQELQEAV